MIPGQETRGRLECDQWDGSGRKGSPCKKRDGVARRSSGTSDVYLGPHRGASLDIAACALDAKK